MARPRKEGMDYFPHDTDAAGDEKIDAMRALFGNDGYAFYFILCERIYRTSNAELDVSKPVLLTPIIKKLLVTPDRFEEMLDAAFELKLLSQTDFEERGVITSHGIKQRFGEVSEMRKRWRKSKENTTQNDVFQAENHVENISENAEETGESKAKQSKVNKINNTTATTSENPFKLFESEGFGTISSTVAEKLNIFIDEYGERWVCEAMKEAVYSGIRRLNYVDGILKRYQSSGVDKPWEVEKQVEKKTEKTNRNKWIPNKPYIPIVRPTKDEDPMTDEEIEEIKKMAEKLKEEPA